MTGKVDNSHDTIKGEDWAGEMGAKWLESLDKFEGMIAPIGAALLARAAFKAGERVLDIGSGGGVTTLEIAKAVGPDGEALGVDISPVLVESSTRRAAAASIGNARFLCADAASVKLADAPFDRLHSRFGSMFFEAPTSAFANLKSLLQPGARIDLAVWGPPPENNWVVEMMGVLAGHVELPPAVPRSPGPFQFEDKEYLNEVLSDAGFSSVEVVAYQGLQPVGGAGATPEQAAQFVLSSMAFGEAVVAQGAEVTNRATADLTALFARHFVAGQGVMMGGKAWLVCATA